MKLNARDHKNYSEEEWSKLRCRVFADGVEIQQAWYVDTDEMIVKSYDVLGDGKLHLMTEPCMQYATREIEVLNGILASVTIRAKVIQIIPFE